MVGYVVPFLSFFCVFLCFYFFYFSGDITYTLGCRRYINHSFFFLACDWSHYNTTQLFWKFSYLFKEASVNCKEVELVVEYE